VAELTAAATPAVVFIGAPGSGKSRIGKRVARLLDLPFVDTDKRIVAAHGPISEIFATFGEPYFREIERYEVERALREPGVISLGGGAILDPRTQDELEPLLVVQLSVTEEALASRNLGVKRPLLPNGLDSWRALMAVRTPIYDRLTDHTWDTSSLPAERIADDIAAWLKEASHD